MGTKGWVVFTIVGGFFAVGILQLTVSSLSKTQAVYGCRSMTTSGLVDPFQTVAFWQNKPINPLTALVDTLSDSEKKVLGTTTDEKWIEVDLTKQKLIAHEGEKVFLESAISSGLWNRTPVGEFRIWYKVRATKMEGGSKLNSTYYYLPNVPYAMFFYDDFGIHGTYWHQNFGQPMSHGCVNAPTLVAEKLFYWADPQILERQTTVRSTDTTLGTRVVIHQ
jgi:lipoprotein-anchoring transpeptidase ErfK/SrfK